MVHPVHTNSSHTSPLNTPRGVHKGLSPSSSKANLVGPAAISAGNCQKSCCAKFWTFLEYFAFPLSWVVAKIVQAVKWIFKSCGEMDRDVSPEPIHTPLTPLSSTHADSIIRPSDSDADKVRKIMAQSTTLLGNISNLDRSGSAALKAMELLQGTPDAPPQALTLSKFFEVIQTASDHFVRLRSYVKNHAVYIEKYREDFGSINKDLLAEELLRKLEQSASMVAKTTEAEEKIKQVNDLISKWEAFVKDNHDELINRFKTYQAEQLKGIDALTAKKDKGGLDHFRSYSTIFNAMNSLGIAKPEDPAHVALMNNRANLTELVGLSNPTATYCWRNSALQAMRGVEEICNRIKTLKAPARLYEESEEAFKKRVANLKSPDPQRQAEAPETFEARVQKYENLYPVARTANVEKMLYEARLAAYEQLPTTHGVKKPELREPESEVAFLERVAKFKLRNLKEEWEKRGDKPDRIQSQLKSFETQYKKNNVEETPIKPLDNETVAQTNKRIEEATLRPIPAETDSEFKNRIDAFQASLNRKIESDERMELKQKFLDALKAVWNAWETDEVALEAALTELQEEIFNGIAPEFNNGSRNQQLDSGDFLAVVFNVLGLSNEMLELRKCDRLKAESRTIGPSHMVEIPLTGNAKDVKNAEGLIKLWAESKPGDASNPWNYDALNSAITDYTDTYRILNDPQPVILLRFNRSFYGNDSAKISAIPNWDFFLKAIASQLNRQPSAARQRAAVERFAAELARDDKLDRPIEFSENGIIDFAPLFDKKTGGKIEYRLNGFTRHLGGGKDAGHYVGYHVDKAGQWWYASDSQVQRKSNDEMWKGKSPEVSQVFTAIFERV